MKKEQNKLQNNVKYFLLDHPKIKFIFDNVGYFLCMIISAFVFAYGFRAFTARVSDPVSMHLISGGASGLSQVVVRIFSLFRSENNPELDKTLQSILYFIINVPIILFAWFKIGKKFTFYTLVNVAFVSIFIDIIPEDFCTIIDFGTDVIARALFAGILTGIHSSLAFIIGASTGGVDVIAMYIADKKSTSTGKFSLFINVVTIFTYIFFTVIDYVIYPNKADGSNGTNDAAKAAITSVITMGLYTTIYSFTSSKILDIIYKKNHKTQLQIITSNKDLPLILIHSFPHAATKLEGKGAYSDKELTVIYMVVSSGEVKNVVAVSKKNDKNCFISATNLEAVYGRFYIKPHN